MRRDCKACVKGVRYNAESDSWSAYVYRGGHAYHLGASYSPEAAAAYEAELRKEDPDLHTAPARVERPAETAAVQRGDPEASCMNSAP